MKLLRTLMLCWILGSSTAAQSEILQGGIDKTEILPQVNLALMRPKLDSPGLSFKENCICINPKNVRKENLDGRWRLIDGENWLLDFGDKADAASQAIEAIEYYGFTDMCTVGHAAPSNKMQYFLVNGKAPSLAPITDEDAIPFDVEKVKAEAINGSWKVTEGDHWMLDFASDEESARRAAEVIHHYGFKYECFIGRPGAPMMYFRR